ncbi:MAG: hypothetical protein ACREIA_15865 [Opitutaceae bacterium]
MNGTNAIARACAWPGWRHAAWGFVCIGFSVTAFHVLRGCVNVPYWDDFDAHLQFLVRIEDAGSFLERVRIATEFHNEHRTLTSRATVWLAHTLGAPMNFRVLGWAGAAMFVPAVLLAGARTGDRNARAAATFFAAAMLFNLQHWENLFWGGSSADHVTVVPLAMLALLLLHVRARWAVAGAAGCGVLASFALAHGLLVFPVGALVLALERRWRALACWCAATAALACGWLFGFPASADHAYQHPEYGELSMVLHFWLGLLGAPLAFGSRAFAPWIGAAIAAAVVWLWRAGVFKQHRYHGALLGFCALALGAIAVGRAEMDSTGFMVSRYRILSCLIVAVLCGLIFAHAAAWPRFGSAARVVLVLAIAGHWLEQTLDHWWRSADFRERQMSAVFHYEKTGTLEGSPTELYYDVPKADAILKRCEKRGIFRLVTKSEPAEDTGQ